MKNKKRNILFINKNLPKLKHRFHLVDNSIWPILVAVNVFITVCSGVYLLCDNIPFDIYTALISNVSVSFGIALLVLAICVFNWFYDVHREASIVFQKHTNRVRFGLRFGFMLFIVSEVMFFFAFFWAFFDSSLVPVIEIGSIWPPENISILGAFSIPFVNTCILLLSSFTATRLHKILFLKNVFDWTFIVFWYAVITLVLAVLFLFLQYWEYKSAAFDISDGVYGSSFFLLTGFHGFHVMVGTVFLIISLIRFFFASFLKQTVGFDAAVWYWHFVDVVWLFLFVSIYWWGGL